MDSQTFFCFCQLTFCSSTVTFAAKTLEPLHLRLAAKLELALLPIKVSAICFFFSRGASEIKWSWNPANTPLAVSSSWSWQGLLVTSLQQNKAHPHTQKFCSCKKNIYVSNTFTYRYSTLHCTTLHCTRWRHTTLRYMTLLCITLHHITVRYATAQCNTLHYTTERQGCIDT